MVTHSQVDGRTKIRDESEVLRWFKEGRTYRWMVEQYATKYDAEVGISMFSNFRRRHGLDRRQVRDDELIPWKVKVEHRYAYPVMQLRSEARRRAGKPDDEEVANRVAEWAANLKAEGLVVHYDPDTEDGWFYVPARPGIDTDLIREPDRKTTERPNTDK